MKNLNTLLFYLCLFGAIPAQILKSNFNVCDYKPVTAQNTNILKSSTDTIVYNTFDNINDWTISAPNLQGQWEVLTTTPADVDTYMGTMASSTASDGFAVFNGIQYLLNASGLGVDFQNATIELNDTIDFSNYPSVTLEFEQRYRAFNYDKTYVELSTDLGLTWTQIELNDQVTTNDPAVQELIGINISSYVGGQSDVKIRFRWMSDSDDDAYGSGYGWLIDDLKITVPPENDVQNVSSWIFGENSSGAEYGRTPISHVEQNFYVGSSVYNYGSMDQTNILVNGDFTGPTNFTTSATSPLLVSDSSQVVESLNPISLSVGSYSGTITVYSMGDTLGSGNFDDNIYLRNFEVTNDVYSLDGLGIHPPDYEAVGSLGSNSWTSASDGLVCATLYPIKQQEVINSVRAYLQSSSVAQSEVILYILDSLSFTNGLFSNSIFVSELYTVTAQDISNGYIEIPVANNTGWDPLTNSSTWENLTLPVGNYYAALELYSGGNTYDIRILDDNTVAQPGWSSAIWFPGDQAYTNGNAFAIRMIFGNNVNVHENQMSSLELFPNPANNIININLKNNISSNYEILDISGKVLLSDSFLNETQINSSDLKNGIYIIRVVNDFKSFSKRITITD
jgi:hypothetical protein